MSDFIYIVYAAVECIIAIYFVWFGARMLIRNKPILVQARQFILIIIPLVLLPIILLFSIGSPLLALFYVCSGAIIIYAVTAGSRGYSVVGITDESMLEALHRVLAELALPYEESLGQLRLPTLNAELQVLIQGWMGVGHLLIKPAEQRATLIKIVDALRDYFSKSTVPVNRITPVSYVIAGLFIAAFALAMLVFVRGS